MKEVCEMNRVFLKFNILQKIVLLFLCSSLSYSKTQNGLKHSPLTYVSAVVGSHVLLPCNVDPPDPTDRPILVLFYQGGIGTPVYSLDARDGPLSYGLPWVDKLIFGPRVTFELDSKSQGLILQPVEARDHASYRCRVDFKSSPTRNSRIQLDVVVPPSNISLTNGAGAALSGIIGPYNLGADVILSCKVEGGRPRPQVSWWWRDSLIDGNAEVLRGDLTINTVTIHNLQRDDLFRVLTCEASNTNKTSSLKGSVKIDMTLPPSEVRIEGNEEPVKEGGISSLTCYARGSKPPAEITWWKDSVSVSNTVSLVNEDKNETRSSLRLHLKMEDDQSQIICRAKNPFLSTSVVEATRKIDVHYSPRLKLIPGQNINMNNIEEGVDVYIECAIRANPKATLVNWYHEGKILEHNVAKGVIQSNQSLVLQRVRKKLSGHYVCSASNSEGTGSSNKLFISVKYLPDCQKGQQLVYGAEKDEEINASCGVDANPSPSAYQWAFNSSSEVVELAHIKGSEGGKISYTPETDLDFGSLLCWALNDVGKQKEPCVFHVIHSVIPEPVSNCTVFNITSVSASVSCLAGWDGGLEQSFRLKISRGPTLLSSTVESITLERDLPRVLAKTSTTPKPHFLVSGLRPGSDYQVSISALNKKGRSQEKFIVFTTPGEKIEHKGTPETKALKMGFSSMVAVLSLICTIFLVGCVIIIGVLLSRRGHAARREAVKMSFTKGIEDANAMEFLEFSTRVKDRVNYEDLTSAPDIIPNSSQGEKGSVESRLSSNSKGTLKSSNSKGTLNSNSGKKQNQFGPKTGSKNCETGGGEGRTNYDFDVSNKLKNSQDLYDSEGSDGGPRTPQNDEDGGTPIIREISSRKEKLHGLLPEVSYHSQQSPYQYELAHTTELPEQRYHTNRQRDLNSSQLELTKWEEDDRFNARVNQSASSNQTLPKSRRSRRGSPGELSPLSQFNIDNDRNVNLTQPTMTPNLKLDLDRESAV